VFNDAAVFLTGCRLKSDMTNNGIVDLSDIVVTFNTASIFATLATPCPGPLGINGHDIELPDKNSKKFDHNLFSKRILF
jgi:hypothetical protein